VSSLQEEYMLLEVINDLINREPGSYYGQYWEERLDLEDALMRSVCVARPFVDPTNCRTPTGVYDGALPAQRSRLDAVDFSVAPPIAFC
jgi:hypothetical protein